jgi:hypothetical protein
MPAPAVVEPRTQRVTRRSRSSARRVSITLILLVVGSQGSDAPTAHGSMRASGCGFGQPIAGFGPYLPRRGRVFSFFACR